MYLKVLLCSLDTVTEFLVTESLTSWTQPLFIIGRDFVSRDSVMVSFHATCCPTDFVVQVRPSILICQTYLYKSGRGRVILIEKNY